MHKVNSRMAIKVANMVRNKQDVRFTLISKLADPDAYGAERVSITGVQMDDLTSVAVGIHDRATSGLNKIRVGVRTVGKLVAKPFISIKDGATRGITKVRNLSLIHI